MNANVVCWIPEVLKLSLKSRSMYVPGGADYKSTPEMIGDVLILLGDVVVKSPPCLT